jgi:hypothetical protein
MFLAITYKTWFLKNWVGLFEDQFLKTVNQLLFKSFKKLGMFVDQFLKIR